jgi:hypothetical protein
MDETTQWYSLIRSDDLGQGVALADVDDVEGRLCAKIKVDFLLKSKKLKVEINNKFFNILLKY